MQWRHNVSVRSVKDADAVGHFKARVFAHGLNFRDQFAFDALFDEFFRERRIQRDGHAPLARGHVSFRALGGDEKVFRSEFHFRAVQNGFETAFLDRRHDIRAVAILQKRADGTQFRAVFGTERFELRFQTVRDERARVLRLFIFFDIEFV